MTESTEKHGHGPHGGHPEHTVTILVDGIKHEVHPGPWVVRDLKVKVEVPAAKVLEEITPQGLNLLDDNATITVHEGQRFMSHVRTGGSS